MFEVEGELGVVVKHYPFLVESNFHGDAHLALISTDVVFDTGMKEFGLLFHDGYVHCMVDGAEGFNRTVFRELDGVDVAVYAVRLVIPGGYDAYRRGNFYFFLRLKRADCT